MDRHDCRRHSVSRGAHPVRARCHPSALSGDVADRAGAGVASQAADANDYILFDTTSGTLYYDADGSGAGGRIAFARLNGLNGTLDTSDFTTVIPTLG